MMKKAIKFAVKTVCLLLAILIVVVGSYLAYVFLSYHRLGNAEQNPAGMESRLP